MRRVSVALCCGLFFAVSCAGWAQTATGVTDPDTTASLADLKDPVITKPRLLHSVDAKYPREARKKKLGATSVVDLIVDTLGVPQDVHVVGSAADKLPPKYRDIGLLFDKSAVDAVVQYRFAPSEKDGKPVSVHIHVETNFQMR